MKKEIDDIIDVEGNVTNYQRNVLIDNKIKQLNKYIKGAILTDIRLYEYRIDILKELKSELQKEQSRNCNNCKQKKFVVKI